MSDKLTKCAWCGSYFTASSRRRESRQIYCSVKCRGKAGYARKVETLKNNPKTTRQKKEIDWSKVQSKPWDNKDPDCQAVIEFLKTVQPIDWQSLMNETN